MVTEGYKKRMQELAGIKKKKEIIFLVGLPGSGKSTFIKSLRRKNPEVDYVVASHDDILEDLGAEMGMSYNDAYKNINFKEKLYPIFVDTIKKAVKKGKNIIVDCTNMKRSDRVTVLEMVSEDYKKIAVVFNVPPDELKKRLKKRERETGKYIPDEAIEKMRGYYIPPSKSEGFNKIINL